ncbi:sulfurtransferase TusA family protein [Gallaecimonas sp. GXIMD4217]|uniref:sulfurtransferase TusA family protein n=1 Tax=Gallaecimonas sp. GXIMD4217 TaxID=3131927 RepID=UPI00311B3E0B
MMTTLDLRGLSCPVPLVETKLALRAWDGAEPFRVLISDPGSRRDIPNYLKKAGYAYQSQALDGGAVQLSVLGKSKET